MLDELEGAPSFTDAPKEDESNKLREIGIRLYTVDKEIADLEAQLKAKTAIKTEIQQHELPDYMKKISQDKIGLPEFQVDLVMEAYYHANIKAEWPEEQRKAGFDYLEELNAGDLIKTQVVFLFGRKDMKKVKWLLAFIKTVQHYLTEVGGTPEDIPDPTVSMAVPWNTLTAFVKEQVTAGKKLDLEKLGATVGSIVKIKPRK